MTALTVNLDGETVPGRRYTIVLHYIQPRIISEMREFVNH